MNLRCVSVFDLNVLWFFFVFLSMCRFFTWWWSVHVLHIINDALSSATSVLDVTSAAARTAPYSFVSRVTLICLAPFVFRTRCVLLCPWVLSFHFLPPHPLTCAYYSFVLFCTRSMTCRRPAFVLVFVCAAPDMGSCPISFPFAHELFLALHSVPFVFYSSCAPL